VNNHRFDNRRIAITVMILAVVLLYVIRLFTIQVVDPKYKNSADNNALYYKTIYPMRGGIFDRNEEMIVNNQTSYDVLVVLREINDLDTLRLCGSLDITKEFFDNRMADIKDIRKNPGYSRYTPQVFMSQLSVEEISNLRENLYRFSGFSLNKRSFRLYAHDAAAHMLGDLGEVSKVDIEKDDYYVQGDFIGKQGVEKQYEKQLRGRKGVEVLLKDAYGRIQGSYHQGELDITPESGSDLTLGIDIELQELGEKLMKNKIGSIVAIEPETGEILCMVSAPTFSPTDLVGRHRGENFKILSDAWSKPLINRTIQGTYPPGSTFKTAQALTQLQEGIIDTNTMFQCHNGFIFGRLKVGCHAHAAPLSLIPAIATSCNGYFCWGYYRMMESDKYSSPKEALTVWKDYMVNMGFGYTLGIDLPGEARGMIPNAQYYDKLYNKSWRGLTIISNAIGQGEVTLTPLQIANLCATIANRGYYITPHVVKKIENGEIDSIYSVRHYTKVDRENYEYVVEGMRQSVLGGTCRSANTPLYELCGKTGTAQNNGKDHSVFMGFAPRENPKIAIAVYVENGGFGATYGVPIGALLIEKYLTDSLSTESQIKADMYSERVISYDEQKR
jgi:penicillin-binding protein 2